MTRTEVRLLPIGVGLLGASAVLLELLTFRLVTATISRDVAVLMSLLAPAVAGVGGMLVARRAADTSGAGLDKSAAHLTALAGTFACLAIIGLTYASQRVANAGGEAGPREVVVTLFACLLPFSFHGAALAVVMRRGAARIGRYGFIAALGGALACIALPWLLDSGAPRALIVTGFLLGVAALLLAHCGSEAEPRTAVMWTLPLAATALIAGDIGAPWLKLRLDTGRRSNLEEVVWTPQGAIGVDKVRRLKSHLRLDRYDAIPLAEPVKEKRKPPFKGQDLIYLTSKNDKGPVLVVGSVGGREAAVALAEGHPHVDAMEQHGALVNDLLRDRYARLTGNLYRDDERVTPLIGDGLRSLDALGREYQHVVVMAEGGLDQSPPRFLTATERMLTVEALRRYLLRLREDGSMLVRAQLQALPALFAAAKEALVEVTEAEGDPDQHLLACVNARTALLVATRQPLDPMLTRNLQKRCQRSRLTVEFPLAPVEGQPSPTSMVGDLTGVKLPEAGRPYALANPPLAELPKAVWPALQTLGPAEPLPEGEKPKDDDEDEEEGEALSHPPGMIQAGLTLAGVLGALFLLLAGLVVAPPTAKGGAPLPLRLAFPFFGAAQATILVGLGDRLVAALCDAAYGWYFVVPVSLVGIGAGRLWTDAMDRGRGRSLLVGLGVGALWLVGVAAVTGSLAGLSTLALTTRLTAALGLLVVTGWVLGWPLTTGARLLVADERPTVAWAWGAHLAGWGFGGGLAALVALYAGIPAVMVVGVGAFVVGAALMLIGSRRLPA